MYLAGLIIAILLVNAWLTSIPNGSLGIRGLPGRGWHTPPTRSLQFTPFFLENKAQTQVPGCERFILPGCVLESAVTAAEHRGNNPFIHPGNPLCPWKCAKSASSCQLMQLGLQLHVGKKLLVTWHQAGERRFWKSLCVPQAASPRPWHRLSYFSFLTFHTFLSSTPSRPWETAVYREFHLTSPSHL